MEPDYYSPLTSFPLELKEDHKLMINLNQASSSSPASCHSFFEPVQQQEGFYHMESHLLQHSEEGKKFFSQAGSCDSPGSGSGIKRNENHQCDQNSSVKWMSSKMRLMKKMMNSDAAAANNSCMKKLEDQIQKQPPSSSLETDRYNSYSSNNNSTNTNTIIRVCADCNTTKTPLWRGGPKGPKSLCNACGIRQRKARRAAAAAAATAAAAAAAANGTAVQLTADASSNKKSRVQDKDKTSSPSNNNNSCLPFKKRCKFNSNNSPSHGKKNNLCFEDLTLILSKNSSALQRVFPQDEKEAAILLMALSHGLVHG